MTLSILLLILGLALVVFGADFMVDGATKIARRWGLSEFLIGLTVVGIGTSAPEMAVSFIGAAQGNASVSLGNVIGSNIINVLLILGLTAVILPMAITKDNRKLDIPLNIVVTALLVLLGLKHSLFGIGKDELSYCDGALFLLLFIAYMIYCFKSGKSEEVAEEKAGKESVFLSLLMVIGGIAGLVFGGRLFVDNATGLARELGISDKFIAITILAGGTSLPELATCVAAAVKKKGQLALGNIIGSNLFNILLILGGSALISPLSFEGIGWVDISVLGLSAVYLLTCNFMWKKNILDRFDGAAFLLTWAAYMVYLFINL